MDFALGDSLTFDGRWSSIAPRQNFSLASASRHFKAPEENLTSMDDGRR